MAVGERALGLSPTVAIHSLVPLVRKQWPVGTRAHGRLPAVGWGLGSMYTVTWQDQRFHRRKPNYCHTGPECTSIGELKNLDINYHLQSYVMDRFMVFFKNLGGCWKYRNSFKGNMHMISPDRTRFYCQILAHLVTIHLLYGTRCLSYWFC